MIEFDADGIHYRLEVTPYTIKQMEKSGVNFAELGDKLLAAETLWKGLFVAHHAGTPDTKRMEIYNSLCAYEDGGAEEYDEAGEQKDGLMLAVFDEYERAIKAMQRSRGNVPWKRT